MSTRPPVPGPPRPFSGFRPIIEPGSVPGRFSAPGAVIPDFDTKTAELRTRQVNGMIPILRQPAGRRPSFWYHFLITQGRQITETVKARSRCGQGYAFLHHLKIFNKSSQLKKNGQGGQGGQGRIYLITYARARMFFVLDLYFSFIKKYLDHLDRAFIDAGLYPDRPPCPPLTTLTKPVMTGFSEFLSLAGLGCANMDHTGHPAGAGAGPLNLHYSKINFFPFYSFTLNQWAAGIHNHRSGTCRDPPGRHRKGHNMLFFFDLCTI